MAGLAVSLTLDNLEWTLRSIQALENMHVWPEFPINHSPIFYLRACLKRLMVLSRNFGYRLEDSLSSLLDTEEPLGSSFDPIPFDNFPLTGEQHHILFAAHFSEVEHLLAYHWEGYIRGHRVYRGIGRNIAHRISPLLLLDNMHRFQERARHRMYTEGYFGANEFTDIPVSERRFLAKQVCLIAVHLFFYLRISGIDYYRVVSSSQ